jgi:hypothetical protein
MAPAACFAIASTNVITFLDNAGPYRLPTGWHEVRTRQFCTLERLQLPTVEARASYFAGRPIQVNGTVADALAFLVEGPPPAHGPAFDLGQYAYLRVETMRDLLSQQPLHACYADVYACAADRFGGPWDQAWASQLALLVPDWPVTDTYPVVARCLAELQRLAVAFAPLAAPDATEAGRRARAAGSDRLAVFQHLNVARHYAERFGTTIEAVYHWPWQQVALFLWQDQIQAEINDNLQTQSTQPATSDE